MVFSSMIFLWVFLPITLVLYLIAVHFEKIQLGNLILLIGSLIFYAWGEPIYILLMILSITLNYVFGILVGTTKSALIPYKKLFLALGVLGNLLLLAYFKYFNFIAAYVNYFSRRNLIGLRDIALPLGISFYTFQAMSYVVDVYRGEVKVQKNYLNLMLYVSFFPQLVAGPIVKYKDIEEQLMHRTNTAEKRAYGVKRFLYGMGKKVLLANVLGYYVDMIYAHEPEQLSTGLLWLVVLLYPLQIYYDFSGYSDMAIGLGRIFGFEFQENFDYPYVSKSIREYWRRWHISLSTWFREYVYIPLGGNRKGKVRTYFNLFVIFFLTGLWHGAATSFVLWGIFHGIFMMVERAGFGKVMERTKVLGHIYMLAVVDFGFILFRTESLDKTLRVIKRLFAFQSGEYTAYAAVNAELLVTFVLAILGAGVIQYAFPRVRERIQDEKTVSVLEMVYLFVIFFLCVMSLASSTYNPFIYFRF